MNMNKEFTRSLKDVFGMSLRPAPPTDSFAYLENMYVDHEGGGEGVESIPGYKKILSLGGRIHSMCRQDTGSEKYLIIHCGSYLYRIKGDKTDFLEKPLPILAVNDGEGYAFAFGSLALVSDGASLYLIDYLGEVIKISDESFAVRCTKMALFDGRLFLAGNEDFPDRIFYSTRISREGFSLSKESYLQVCSAGARIKALLSFGGRLWVFKSADDGDGSIISYKADDVGYAVDRVLSSVACVGEAIGYGGEIIFTAHDGLYAIEQPMKEADVKIVCRSYDIAPMLLEERLKEARLTVWRGYLALCLGEHIYLADPRGKKRYDWYYLCGIGGHKNDRTVYRYASFAEEGFEVFANPDARAEGEVISLITEDGRAIYYESRDGRKYALYPTPEMTGGELLPARLTLSDGDYLWFCSGEGDLFLFNRGRPEDTEDFYSFDRHAPRYTVSYRPDDCDIPELCKSTVGGSLLLKLKALPGSGATVKISADSGEICSYIVSAGETSFSDMDFSNFSLSQHGHCFVTLPERASGWREKQITISSDEYASPLGVCRVSYRYRIKDGS